MKTYTYSYQNGLCRGREAGRVPEGTRMHVPGRAVGPVDHSPGRNPGGGETPGVWTIGAKPWAGRVRPIRAPGTGRIHVPGYDHSSLAGCLVGRMQYAPTRVVHSGPFGYPAKFAGVRRRPPLHGYVHSGPFGYPASFPAPAGAVRRRPILPGDGCRDRRRRHRAFRVSYRPRPASWDPSASRHRASSVPSVPWAAWDLWDPSAA